MTDQTDTIVRGEGSALVFLHGAGVDKDLWHPQIAAFSKTYKVVVPTLPGHSVRLGKFRRRSAVEAGIAVVLQIEPARFRQSAALGGGKTPDQ